MKEIKFDDISNEEAIKLLTEEVNRLKAERERLIGNVHFEARVNAFNKGIKNIEAIIANGSSHIFKTRNKRIFVYVPLVVEEYYESWDEDDQKWVAAKKKQYDSTGYIKPRYVPADKVFVQSNRSDIEHCVDILNNEHIMPVYCKVCDMPFAISPNERNFFFNQGIPLPKRCPACRAISRARKERQEDGTV